MEELELTEIIEIIKKRKFVLFQFILVSVILTTIYLYEADPVYQATTKVLIESKPPKTVSIENILAQGAQDEQFFITQYSLFQSRSLIKKLLVKLDLLGSEEFAPHPFINIAPLKDWIKSKMIEMGIIKAKKDPADPYSTLVDEFVTDRLEISPIEDSKIVVIRFQGYSATLTAKITNTLVDLYIASQVEYGKILEADAEKWLKFQSDTLSKRLEASNSKMREFIKRERMVELDDKRDFTNQQYRETLSATTQVQTKIIKLRSIIQQVENFKTSPKQLFDTIPEQLLDSIPESLKDATITKLRSSYLDEVLRFENLSKNLEPSHPDLIQSQQKIKAIEARIPAEMDRLLKSLKTDYKATLRQEQELALLQNRQKENLMELDKKTIQFKKIEEKAESNKKLLDQLLDRGNELGVYSSYYVPPIRIVDRAEVPTKPIKPKVSFYLILSLCIGIFGGLILIFLVESIDDKIISEDDANRQLPYYLLGSVGMFGEKGIFNSAKKIAARYMKEFQNLRTKFLPLLSENSTKVFMVTSTYPGEGKTTVTANLAVSLGEVGKKVVIIDADLENPKIHTHFGTEKNPGILKYLSNSKMIQPTPIETKNLGVWVIPADEPSNGSSDQSPSSPDVLFSLYFPSLLYELKKNFDVILIKSAPVLCGTHTRIIENFCDGILFVMASGRSDKKIIQNMVGRLASTPVEIKKRRILNGASGQIPELPGETNSNFKRFRIILTKVKDKKEEIYGYEQFRK